MLRSLRSRLLLSHFGPVLLLLPLLGLVLTYLVETRYALGVLADNLSAQGRVVAQMTHYTWSAWHDPQAAEPMMAQLQVQVPARVVLWDRDGTVLVAPGTLSASRAISLDGAGSNLVRSALEGEAGHSIQYGLMGRSRRVDVAIPIWGDQEEIVGAVQLTQGLGDVADRLVLLRWLVWGTLVGGIAVAGLLSFSIASSLNRPLEHLTEAVRSIRQARHVDPVLEQGPAEVQELAQAFNEMARRLNESEETRRRLLRSIVHELGRPLGAIKAAAQVMQRDSGDPAVVQELATGVDDQVDRLRRLVDDLTLLAQSEVQELEVACQPVGIGDLVQEECRRSLPHVQEKAIRLHCSVADDLPAVQADPDRFSQIVGNLLDNAVKYAPVGGQVTIRAEEETRDVSTVVVTVEDNGPGIEEAERENIFQFFYRVPTQGTVRDGMGIGLALARRLAEAQGGTLRLAETSPSGSRFELRLPVAADHVDHKEILN